MLKPFVGVAAAVLGVTALGCGGKSNSATWTCDWSASIGFCRERSAPNYLDSSEVSQLQQAEQQSCTSSSGPRGAFSTGSNCPSMNRVGSCAVSYVQGERGVPYDMAWYSPIHSAQAGQSACTAFCSGHAPICISTWTAG
jgi:hypothetical protein